MTLALLKVLLSQRHCWVYLKNNFITGCNNIGCADTLKKKNTLKNFQVHFYFEWIILRQFQPRNLYFHDVMTSKPCVA